MLNLVDFVAEGVDIGNDGEDFTREAVEVLVIEVALLIAEDYVRCCPDEIVRVDAVCDVLRVLYCCFALCVVALHVCCFHRLFVCFMCVWISRVACG